MGIWKASRSAMDELSARGVRARGTVTRIAKAGATSGANDSVGGGNDPEGTTRIKTTVQIPLPTGGSFECRTRLTFRIGLLPKAGDSVPLIYDPDDHSVVEVDDAVHLREMWAAQGIESPRVIGREIAGDVSQFDPAALADGAAQAQQAMSDHLAQMRQLHAQGVLSDEQFEQIRRQIPGQG